MNRIIAYLRTSTDKQDLQAQKLEILEYARQNRLQVDDFIAIAISSRRSQRARRLEELLELLETGDTLLVTELSRLGRSTGEVINLIDGLVANDIRVIIIKQNLTLDQSRDDIQSLTMITLLSLFAEMERMMISRRTKEALAIKRLQGVQLGKPKGTIQSSMYDEDRERIAELLSFGVSIRRISADHLKYGHPSSLSAYIKARNLQAEVDNLKQKRG